MRWRTEPLRVLVGPQGVVIDQQPQPGEQPVPDATLSIANLAGALHALALPAGTRLAVIIDEAWVRSLLLTLPASLSDSDEIRAYAGHRLQDTFGAGPADWIQARAQRSGLPWPGARWQRHTNPLLIASLPVQLLQAIEDWRRAGRLRLVRLGTAWGEALTAVPPQAQGALAVFRGQRMSVGAWSGRRWLGWRSFIAADAAWAAAETRRWMSTLAWQDDSVALWAQGWDPSRGLDQGPEASRPERWTTHPLKPELPAYRAAAFAFHKHRPGHPWSPRHRLLGFALLATLAASVWVTLPAPPLEADEEAIVSASVLSPRVQTADESARHKAPGHDEPTQPEAGDGTAAEAEPEVQAEPEAGDIEWPQILGTFEQQGQRWVLYSSGQESASLRRGAIIDHRYRIERADAASVVLTDLHTLQQRQTVLEPAGDQP